MNFTDLQSLLKESSFFSVLSDEELARLSARFELAHYPLGRVVCRKGDVADALYVVYSGRARVIAPGPGDAEVTVGTLSRGHSFGEQGLLADARREYTVRAAADLTLLRLSREDFARLLKERPDLRGLFETYVSELSVRNFLKLCSAFAPLTADEIRGLLGSMQVRDYAPGEAVVREGEPGDAFYLMRSGRARVVKGGEDGRVLNRVKAGDAFGELALLTGRPRAASVIAEEPSSVFRLDRVDFERALNTSGRFKDVLVNIASGYSRAAVREGEAEPAGAATAELPPAPAELPPATAYAPRRARRYPTLLQLSETDCGAACLAMALRYYGKHVSINRLRGLAGVGREGATLYAVAEGAEALGFQTRGVRASYEQLLEVSHPSVAHWEGYHFVVVYEVAPDRVVLADPAVGLRRLSRAQFEKGWTGYLLLLTPTPRLEGVEESKGSLARFLPLLRPHRALLLEVVLASLLMQVFGLAAPIFTQVIVDRAVVQKSVPLLNLMLAGMLIVAVSATLTSALRYYLLVHTTRRIDLRMVVDFYRHLMSLPLRYFEERKVGDILRRFNENARIRDFLTGRALTVALDCLMIFVYLGLMFHYNAKLALLSLVFLPGYALLTAAFTPVFKRQSREAFEKSAEADSLMVESVTGIGTVKATAAELRTGWRLEETVVRSLNVQLRGALSGMAAASLAQLLQTLNVAFLLWYGARLVIAGELTVGQLVAFNVLVGSLTRPVLGLVDLWREFQEINVALERLNDVFDAEPEEDPALPGRLRLPPVRGHIKFEQVTFRYPTRPDRNALQNVSLEIQPGQTVALVGRSGAGKSTFANLLLRLHEPNSGRILIDGHDLRGVSASSLRAQVGVVPQEVFLFSGTIRENIALGEEGAPLEEVVGAASLAGAHDFISELPLGYETRIGERGQSLSGGQRQRIAIARALYKKPRILVFDEATSALDTESERAIQQNLEGILGGRTTLIIAHRLSTVRNADLIVVMDRGAVVEAGTHYSLMELKGQYYYLHGQQLEG